VVGEKAAGRGRLTASGAKRGGARIARQWGTVTGWPPRELQRRRRRALAKSTTAPRAAGAARGGGVGGAGERKPLKDDRDVPNSRSALGSEPPTLVVHARAL